MTKAERVLALLETLQDRASATGPELAAKLGTDVRTVRRDVQALRALGIPVEGERGRGGSYRLKPGYRVPPLMFTTNEAVAVTLGLMAARRLGLETTGALDKVRRVLPDRIRGGVESLEGLLGFTEPITPAPPDPETLLILADAAGRHRKVAAGYTDFAGHATQREFSPYGLVAHNGRWYVPAYDDSRKELRALRADRVTTPKLAGPGHLPPQDFDAVGFVTRTLARVPWAHEIEVHLEADPEQAARRFPPGLAEFTHTADGTILTLRAESLDWAAALLAGSGLTFSVRKPDALRASLNRLADRLRAA
jgi:predicted DNA-binding transcriptional regulator YafY